jgi:hypothetical protein
MLAGYQKAGELRKRAKNVMAIRGALEVVFAAAAARAYAGANGAVHHVHVAVAPGAQLFIQL